MKLIKMAEEKASKDKAWLENNIYTYLKPVIYTQKEFIFRVGEPLDSMLYIVDGTVIIYTTGNSSDSPSMIHDVLMSDGAYGDEQLMRWDALTSTHSLNYSLKALPPSTENVRCHTKVEGFVLTAEDLKTVLHNLEKYRGDE
jgi:cyclic nucleotide gated channel